MLALLRLDIDHGFMGFKGKHRIVLDLEPGLYFVTGKNLDFPRMGPNACGKSTLFNGIYWCITGQLMDLNRPGDEVIPWTATSRKVDVTLWFEIDDQYYGLKRERGPNALMLRTGRDGEWKPVDQPVIDDLFGLSDAAWKSTIFLGQFSDLFLDLQPREQSQFFSEILSLDLWLDAAKEASNEAAKANVLYRSLQDQALRLGGSLQTTEDQLTATETSKKNWASDQQKVLEEAKEFFRNSALVLVRAKAALPKDPGAINKEIEAERATIKTLEQHAQTLRTEQANNMALVRQYSSDTIRLETTRTQLINAKVSKTCPECGQKVTIKHLDDKLKAVDQEIDVLASGKFLATTKVAVWEKKLEKNAKALDDADEALSPKLRKHAEAVDLYVNSKSTVSKAEQVVKSAEERIAAIQAERNPHIATEERLGNKLAELDDQIAKNQTDTVSHQKKVEAATELERLFKEIRLSLIDEVLVELEVTIGAAAEQLGLEGWHIKFSTEKELKSGGTSVALTTMLYPPGIDKGINWRVYSGGERQRWQMAVTFGLSEVLLARAGLESNLEGLDEPSHGLSAEGLDDLIEHLSQRAHTQRKAILFIDHHILDRGLFDHTIVAVRENGESKLEAA